MTVPNRSISRDVDVKHHALVSQVFDSDAERSQRWSVHRDMDDRGRVAPRSPGSRTHPTPSERDTPIAISAAVIS